MTGKTQFETALQASQGWGGDHHQVYYNDVLSQTVLAADWVWDTPRDATQFKSAITKYLDARFRGSKINRTEGKCWEPNRQVSCLFVNRVKTLWLLTPDMTVLDAVVTQYPEFQ